MIALESRLDTWQKLHEKRVGKFSDDGRGDGRLFNTVLRALGCTFICFLVVPLRVPFKLDLDLTTDFLNIFAPR